MEQIQSNKNNKEYQSYKDIQIQNVKNFKQYFTQECQITKDKEFNPYIIPQPQIMQIKKGYIDINQETVFKINLQNIDYQQIKDQGLQLQKDLSYFEEQLQIYNINIFKENQQLKPENIININISQAPKSSQYLIDSYNLNIDNNQIQILIEDFNNSGLFYSIQTLKQILFQYKSQLLPNLIIKDYARFSYRGQHLDVARHFQPVSFVKQFLDEMAFLKLNKFHFHLIDDQGWRIEMKKYPELTKIGAYRQKTKMSFGQEPLKMDDFPHEGFYTKEDLLEIVEHAKLNHIDIIPEVEGPGHVQSLIASYPEFGCYDFKTFDKKLEVMFKQGISRYLLNMEDSTFDFFFEVYDYIISIFPYDTIHIGGDEVRYKEQWEKSSLMDRFMKKNNLKIEEIQSYYTKKITDYLISKNKKVAAWNEVMQNIPEHYEDKVIIMAWQRPHILNESTRYGYKTIASCQSFLYFDIFEDQEKQQKDGKLGRSGAVPLKKTYNFQPTAGMKQQQANNVIGVQGQAWTETMRNPKEVQYKVFPRIFALSEISWSEPHNLDEQYLYFIKKLKNNLLKYLKVKDIQYCDVSIPKF